MKKILNVILALVILALAACSPQTPTADKPAGQTGGKTGNTVAQSAKTRLVSGAPQEDIVTAAAGNNAFALDLYHKLTGQDGNLFFSPYSISLALAMTEAGAAGNTRTQMDQVMHYTLPQDRLHAAFNALSQSLASRPSQADKDQGDPFRLSIANAIWGQQDYKFLSAYLDVLAENYGAGMRLMDFKSDPEACRNEINAWVEKETEQKIKNLLPAGVLNSDTRLVLTNAIYFKASWQYAFQKEATKDSNFTNLDGKVVKAPQMQLSEKLGYYAGEGYQMVELPYVGGGLVMDILVPDAGKFSTVESGLTNEDLLAAFSQLGRNQVNLAMPKFSYEAELSLTDTLQALGMTDAFSGDADFSGMDGSRSLAIAEVIHKAFVAVDESGTEAAAATAVIMMETSALVNEPVTLTIDRPFIYVIRDVQTGAVLFMGRVVRL
ncbi:MAG TPA: serpin family protein [Anaerolineaceae bacterium]|nr:serpin family protein [Anaerolineaceae bacterium]HPN52126.1 serpin family protein [Anaerolineaceae bacterium]